MKRFIIAIIIFILLIGICIFGLFEVYHVKNELVISIQDISVSMENGDTDLANQKIDQLIDDWVEYEKKLVRFIGHVPLNEISSILEELHYYLQYGDHATFFAELNHAKSLIEHIWYTEIPTLNNIF